jgi:hypothetical protein
MLALGELTSCYVKIYELKNMSFRFLIDSISYSIYRLCDSCSKLINSNQSLTSMFGHLTPKRRSLVFGPFLKFGQFIVDAIFVPKTSNFW